jgi:hypothetical protein
MDQAAACKAPSFQEERQEEISGRQAASRHRVRERVSPVSRPNARIRELNFEFKVWRGAEQNIGGDHSGHKRLQLDEDTTLRSAA